MNTFEQRQYGMLLRVRDFGDRYGHLFPASSVAGQNFAAVAAAIKELDAQELTHMAASVSARGHQRERARATLLARLQAVGRTARVLAADVPGLDRDFRVPSPAADATLLTVGRKFARDAEPLASRFVAQGMPATFPADLNLLVQSFERALHDRSLGREGRRTARASVKAILSSSRAAVRSLDAIVINHFLDDAVTRTVWERERRIVYQKRADATAQPAPSAGTADTPADSRAA